MDHDLGAREGGERRRPPADDAPTEAWAPDDEKTRAWSARESLPEERRWPRAGATTEAADRADDVSPPVSPPPLPMKRDIAANPQGEKKPAMQVRRLRRGRLAIRKIDPWAVLKFSLVFYFCMLLIFLLGTAVIFATLKAFGVIDNIERVLRNLQIDFTIAGGTIFRWFFLIGLVGTVVASAITVFLSFLYNLIADVVGGIELLVTERE